MNCCRCKQPIRAGEKYKYLNGAGEAHDRCPPPPDVGLFGEDERMDVDQDAAYPDWS